MHRLRPILGLILVLAFALGGGHYSPQAGAMQAGDMAAAAHDGMASVDAAMPGDCGGCAKDEMARPACLPVCISVQVILAEGLAMPTPMTRVSRGLAAGERASGSPIRPDPYPPKLIVSA